MATLPPYLLTGPAGVRLYGGRFGPGQVSGGAQIEDPTAAGGLESLAQLSGNAQADDPTAGGGFGSAAVSQITGDAAIDEPTAAGGFASSSPAPSGTALAFYEIPSLADERATYDLLGWARTSGDEAFDFVDLGAITSTDVHDDSEGDNLWTWDSQVQRGYTATIATTMRDRWLTYFRSGLYRADLLADDANRGDVFPSTSADPFCHGYGPGLVRYGYLNGDATAITEAEAIADVGLTALFGSTTAPGSGAPSYGGRSTVVLAASGNNFGVGGGRQMARIGQLVAHLVFATGKAKWLAWLKAITDAYMGASTWAEAPSLGIVQGGAYFCDRAWMTANGQQGTAAYDAGARSNSIYQYGMHAEFLWRAYLLTGRADVRDRLIKFARFMEYYAHNPANTGSGGPFCSSYMGITPGGGYWHRDIPGSAHYDASIVNILVWGYKLTGDSNLLTRARVHLRQGTRWAEGQPGAGGGPLVGANEVADFIDTRRNAGGSVEFTDNKGQLQYAYQVFENGGNPPTLDSGVPNYIRTLAAGNAYAIPNSRISSAFATFAGRFGDPIAVYAYSGGAYDTKRGRFMRTGEGHTDGNGNGVFGIAIYGSETPTWTLFKPHTAPPNVTSPSVVGPEDTPNGDPAASHTYSQVVYDKTADKLVLCGLGSIAGNGGQNTTRFRLLNLTTNAWDAKSDTLLAAGATTQGAAFAYHDLERAIYGRGAGSAGRWYRYDCVAGTLLELAPTGTGAVSQSIHGACAIDPERQYGIWIGGQSVIYGGPTDSGTTDMVLVDFSSRSGASIVTYARSLTGFPSALRADGYALEFHPPSGTFVAWKGGSTLYRLIPPSNPFTGAWSFSTVTMGGDGGPTIGTGTYNRPWSGFRWAPYPNDPSRGVFVFDCPQGSSGAYTASLTHVFKPNF